MPRCVVFPCQNFLEKPEYKRYITDRNLLRKLHNDVCWDNYVLIEVTLLTGEHIRIEINDGDFDPEKHKIKFTENSEMILEVDGKFPFGGMYSALPQKELKTVDININDRSVRTNINEYVNIYEPNFCNFGSHSRITEAYEDGENIYIYIFGGNAADSYFAKLIFHVTEGYITSIISDYVPLSMYSSFGDHFIGF